MPPTEVFAEKTAKIVTLSSLDNEDRANICIADQKTIDSEIWCLVVQVDAIEDTDELTVVGPRRIIGAFIGKNGRNLAQITYNLVREGLQVRRLRFVNDTEDTDA